MRHPRLASLLLLAAMLKFVLWKFFPADVQAYVFHAAGGLMMALLLGLIGLTFMSSEVWLVVALAAGFELQTAGCSIWYIAAPWEMVPGQELCSAGMQMPLGLLGLWMAVCVALYLRRKT